VISRTVTTAIEQLELGQEDQAEVALRQVLQAEPGHRQAQLLLKQIKDDPTALLGRESFAYRVQPGESLSKIAQRFLGDPYLFYGLARYNGIKVPRQLAGGQMIRVPGKAPTTPAPPPPPREPTPPPAPPPAPTPAPPLAPAPAPPAPSAPPPSRPAESPAQRAEREKAEAIARYTREARSSFAKQDLAAAIRAWDKVLELDPNHRTAPLERQKAVDLSERLKKVR
jgi:tetratricopeptide (TPR) repeat protein